MTEVKGRQSPPRQAQETSGRSRSRLPNGAQTGQPSIAQASTPPLSALRRQMSGQIIPGDIPNLQRTIGNQAVIHLLDKQRAGQGGTPALQAKMIVGPARDSFEDEADRIAQQASGAPISAPKAQHQNTTAGTDGKGDVAQRVGVANSASIGPAGGAVDADTSGQIRRMRGGGKPIDKAIRAPLEQTLNTDLSQARLHVGTQSDALNHKVGARAFTTGSDVFMQRSEYKPNSRAGRSLLYHELTHVHQQTGGAPTVQRRDLIQRDDNEPDNDNQQVHEDFSGTGISGYDNFIGGAINTYYKVDQLDDKKSTARKQEKNQKALDYLRGLKNKPQGKQKRQEQKVEKKQMKQLLHFDRKNTKTMDSNQRAYLRAFLVAARAQGATVQELAELKGFFIAKGQEISSGHYQYLLLENSVHIKNILQSAVNANASPPVLNFLYRAMPDRVARTDKSINWLSGKVPKLVEAARNAGKTDTDNSMLRLPAKARQLERAVNDMVAARDQGRYYEAQHMLSENKVLADVVERMAHYAQMRGKSNLHSENETGTAKRLGGGQVSKVYEVNYDPTQQTSLKHGVFKQENFSYDGGDSPAAEASGIDLENPNFGGRSVVTYKVDKLLGIGMTPKTKFGTHGGEGGTVQDWAKGSSPQVLKEDVGLRYRDFDYSDPEIQRQLATLQIFDAITGQVDRHPGNYYIYQGPEGTKVTAIDNDLAFGKDKGLEKVLNPVWQTPIANDQSRGVPLFVDENIAESILKTSSKDFKKVLENTLSPAEVDKALERFALVKAELRKKKANTARIKFMQRKVDVMEKYAGKFGSDFANVEEGLTTQINFYKNEIAKLFAQGAVIDQTQWGQKTAQYLNGDNSYYGLLVESYTQMKLGGKTIPVN